MSSLLQKNPNFTFHALSSTEQSKLVDSEYSALKKFETETYRTQTCTIASKNRSKNRYMDIGPYDASLFPPVPPLIMQEAIKESMEASPNSPTEEKKPSYYYIGGNQIHAKSVLTSSSSSPSDHHQDSNNINYASIHNFVAAHAPLPTCFVDWWETIAQYKVSLVVMLTQEMEGGFPKADRYWPKGAIGSKEKLISGELTLLEERPLSRWAECKSLVRTIEYESKKYGKHVVTHVQYVGWPDHGIPNTTDTFLEVLEILKTWPAGGDTPIFVHCSAGIGRTGTLMTVYYALCLAEYGKLEQSSIFDMVCRLKQHRCGMVQRKEQYAFVYACISALVHHDGVIAKTNIE